MFMFDGFAPEHGWLYIDIRLIIKLPSAAIALKSVIVGQESSKLQTFILVPLPREKKKTRYIAQ